MVLDGSSFMSDFLYCLLIEPIVFALNVIAQRLYGIFYDTGTVLIGLSVFVFLITAPMYQRAEEMQKKIILQQKKMEKWEKHIYATFHGDERLLLRSAYYRINNYRQIDILWSIAPLLLQIPFFMAAYVYLSGSWLLQGQSFMGIADLATPDNLLNIGGYQVHFLPVLMTLINICSALIYHKDSTWKERLQSIALAFFFLVALYNSPAGLVFYWLTNNILSLLRNLFHRFVRNKTGMMIVPACIPALWYLFIVYYGMGNSDLIFSNGGIFPILLSIPIITILKAGGKRKSIESAEEEGNLDVIFLEIALAFLMGGVIPISLIITSPEDFVNIYQFYDPLLYVKQSLLVYFGLFVLWGSLTCFLFTAMKRRIYRNILFVICVVSFLNLILWRNEYKSISNELLFIELKISVESKCINLLCIVIVGVVAYIISNKYIRIFRYVCRVGVLSALIYTMIGCFHIEKKLETVKNIAEQAGKTLSDSYIEPEIRLSKNGHNVILIMLDKAVGAYFPYILEDRPELKEKYAGFTYYPDCLSFGGGTNFGAPAIFGGYEYCPSEMNKRNNENLVDKHNEALSVLPCLFGENGYRVVVADLPLANYHWVPDMSFLDKYPYIEQHLWEGKILEPWQVKENDPTQMSMRYLYYSLYRIAPLFMADVFYEDSYRSSNAGEEVVFTDRFQNAYNILNNLPRLFEVDSEVENSFFMMCNNTTHEPQELQLPDYTLEKNVDNSSWSFEHKGMRMDRAEDIQQYCVNVVSMMRIGDFLDYLREAGVYDNSRIIIVSDHGAPMKQFDNMIFDNDQLDVERFNPLLLVKDFNCTEFNISSEFMTNGDVPTILCSGVIKDPVNPFTGCAINNDVKHDPLFVTTSWKTVNLTPDSPMFQTEDAPWYTVQGSIFSENNWKKVE